MLYVIAVASPGLIIVLYTLVIDAFLHRKSRTNNDGRISNGSYGWKDRLRQLNVAILGLALSSSAAFCLTNILKNAVGRPRPDLIDRCQPRPGSADRPVFGLSTSAICMQTDHAKLKDGFRSWPSGHSSCTPIQIWECVPYTQTDCLQPPSLAYSIFPSSSPRSYTS